MIGMITTSGFPDLSQLPVYADNAAAVAGGADIWSIYRTPAGDLMTVVPDLVGPVISGIVISGITQVQCTVGWNTDEGATSRVEYGLTNAYGSSTVVDMTLLLVHSQNLTGLTAGATYHYRVISIDGSGNQSVSNDATLQTQSAIEFPNAPVIDDTTRANEGPPPSAIWVTVGGNPQLNNNAIKGMNAGEENQCRTVAVYNADQEAYLTVSILPGTNEGISFFGRMHAVLKNGYDFQLIVTNAGTGAARLRGYVMADNQQFGNQIFVEYLFTISAGFKYGFKMYGNVQELWVFPVGGAWTKVRTGNDATYNQPGCVSLGMWSNVAAYTTIGAGNI